MVSAGIVEILLRVKDQATKAFKSARSQLDEISRGAKIAGTAITGFGIGSAYAISRLIKGSNEVETAFAQVNTLLGKGQDAQKLFGNTVKTLNVVLGDQGDQLTVLHGLYQTISAGISDTADAQKFLEVASRAAVGGQAELQTVILAGTKAMASFGLSIEDAERVFDVFAATVVAGQTTLPELANAFPRVAGSAGEMGVSLEETAGILAGLTKILPSTEEAAVSLNAVLTGLLKPTDTLKEVMGDLGYESGQAMIESLGLMGTLQTLKDVAGEDAEAMGEMFGNVRALRAIFPALGGAADEVAASMDIIKASVGLTNDQFEIMAGTTKYELGAATSDLNNVLKELGGELKTVLVPVLKNYVIPAIQAVKKWWDGLSDTTKSFIVKAALITTALALIIGPILLLIGFLPALIAGFTAVGTILGILLGPVGLIIGALVALGIVAYSLYKNWDQVWNWVKDVASAVWSWLKENFFKALDSALVLLLGPIGAVIYAFRHWDEIKDVVSNVWDSIKGMASKVWDILSDLAGDAWSWGKDLIKNFVKGILETISDKLKEVKKAFKKLTKYFEFDMFTNDLMAQRWGEDLIKNFMIGMQSVSGGVSGFSAAKFTNNAGGLSIVIENLNASSQEDTDALFERLDEWQGNLLRDKVRF